MPASDDQLKQIANEDLPDLNFSIVMSGLALTLLGGLRPQGSYLSPRLLLQQHQQLHQLNQEQFQELQQHHQQVQMRMQHHQQQHHQRLSSLVAVDDEDACSASSSYNSPSGSIANHSLVSNSSDNQLDIAATSSAAAVAAAATSVTVGSNSNASTSSAASRPSSAAASGQPPHRKRRYKVQMPEADEPFLCHVCGDKALGYNFDAVTCESCKAFFRRNALKKKVWEGAHFECSRQLSPYR